MSQSPQSQFIALQNRLIQEHPEAHAEATRLADSVVICERAEPQDIWNVLWDKPLYANAKVSVARRWAEALEPFMNDAWSTWGTDPNLFLIRQIAPGISRASFSVEGDLAQDLVGHTRVALHRLYRIQGAASALRKRADVEAKPFSDLNEGGQGLYDRIQGLQSEFGPGWGPITVLHFLTDLGLAVKPDLHLVRTMTTLGLCNGISPNKVPSLKEAVHLNYLVWKLILDIGHQRVTARNLRYTDKILMDISRLGLLESKVIEEAAK